MEVFIVMCIDDCDVTIQGVFESRDCAENEKIKLGKENFEWYFWIETWEVK